MMAGGCQPREVLMNKENIIYGILDAFMIGGMIIYWMVSL